MNKRNIITIFLILIAVIIISYLNRNDDNKEQVNIKKSNEDEHKVDLNIQTILTSAKKNPVANELIKRSYSHKKYQDLKLTDEKRIKKCSKQLSKHFSRSEDTGKINVVDFNLLQKSLVVDCSFKIFSQDYFDKEQENTDLSYQEIDSNDLYRPYTLYLDIFRAFFNNKKEFKEHHNNIHNFIKSNIALTPPSRVGAFYIWMGILDEYTEVCGVKTMAESDNFFTDLDRENNQLFDVSALKKEKGNLQKLNENLRSRREMIKRLQNRLKEYFYKYESDLNNCFCR
ncbi:MAG: hypothetical protein N4A33_01910 [Bacteriovoracaceae bacterium]|jgi:hypothetical protein|nr:hypothetical protein [Bacteriovoracaceae bacterium]